MKILIADDENAMRSILSHFMEQYPSPYTDYMIVDTGEALRNACLQSPPDIVFSDIRMPDLSGLEAIYEIKQAVESETTNYYIISGFGEFEYAQKAIKLGIKDYILKPVRYSTIEKILMDEERNHFLGLSLETAWSILDERKALELSGCIQNLAASFQEGGQAFFNTLSEWKKKSEEKAIAIDPAFFAKRFGKDEDDYRMQVSFLERSTSNISEGSYSKDLMQRITANIDENFRNPSIGLDMIADELGYSTQYLSAIFSKETGIHFSQYLTRKRLSNAKHLLNTTNLKVKDIAEMCGYSYPSYFIKVFRKETGCSPQEWRDEKRE